MTPADFYNACNLTENPFTENPAVASHEKASVWVGYEKEQERLTRVLTQARSDQLGSTRFFLMYGGFGTGKSHALLWAQNLIMHQRRDEFNACAYFIRSLKTQGGKFSFHRAFQEFVINQSDLLADLEMFSHFLEDRISLYKREHGIPSHEDPKKVITQIFGSPELVNLAVKLYEANTKSELSAAIQVNDDFDSVLRFTSLVKLFTFNIPSPTVPDNRFKRAVYLFIDELDDLMGASSKEGRLVNDHLRHLYDSCQGCFGLGIAISAELSELSAFFMDYVLTRIDRMIAMSLLDKKQAVDFIKGMLATRRVAVSDPFYPFTEETVEHLVDQIVQLTPRKLVKAMYETIEQLRIGGYKPSPDNLVTLQVLDDFDIMEEVIECL
ncbi:hypothetical protein [Lysobacter enzymogenes]|uniref:hypothetical protein n=1 Tax=Lysobacter enzymogenes TaxID=69 RepID=UPI001AF061B1|nr:hypothetical protein [Lysobacter enzymogenes]QQP99556.1 hypothetical protein JHW41_15685 [Lysobacter enzymogenes]